MEGSARDLLDWEMALYGGAVLTPDELAQMLHFYKDSGYGLGARTQTVAGRSGYGHGGSLRGLQAVMYRLPEDDLDVVVLANVGFAQPGQGRQPAGQGGPQPATHTTAVKPRAIDRNVEPAAGLKPAGCPPHRRGEALPAATDDGGARSRTFHGTPATLLPCASRPGTSTP